MDCCSRTGPEPTSLEAVFDQWCYALVVVQAGDDDAYYNDYYINYQLIVVILVD